MKEYDTYLFDVDGTLIDTAELIYQCFLYSCKKYADVDVSRNLVMDHIGLPFRAQLETYIGSQTDETVEEIFNGHMKYQKENYSKYLRLFEGVSETLSNLNKAGKKIGIVTSRKRDTLDLYLTEMGIFNYFSIIVSPEDTKMHKPSPEPVEKALSLIESTAANTVYIGDSVYDIESGDSAGCDTIFVHWSAVDIAKCHVLPTHSINSINELIQL